MSKPSSASQQAIQHAQTFLFNRQKAYQHCFNPESQLAKIVMEDLAKFCRAEESTFDADARLHAIKEGRREVYLRIQKHLKLTSEELAAYYIRKGTNNE